MPHRYYVSLLVSLLFLLSHLFSFSWSVFITTPSPTNTAPIRASLPFLNPLLKCSFIRMLLPSLAFCNLLSPTVILHVSITPTSVFKRLAWLCLALLPLLSAFPPPPPGLQISLEARTACNCLLLSTNPHNDWCVINSQRPYWICKLRNKEDRSRLRENGDRVGPFIASELVFEKKLFNKTF